MDLDTSYNDEDMPPPVEVPPPELLGRGRRKRRRTQKIIDMLPPQPDSPVEVSEMESEMSETRTPLRLRIPRVFRTKPDAFGLWREYVGHKPATECTVSPEHDNTPTGPRDSSSTEPAPTAASQTVQVASVPEPPAEHAARAASIHEQICSILDPFPNLSSFLYQYVLALYPTTSNECANTLKDVMCNATPEYPFSLQDLKQLDYTKMKQVLSQCKLPWQKHENGWRKESVRIWVPISKPLSDGPEETRAQTQARRRNTAQIAENAAGGQPSQGYWKEHGATSIAFDVDNFHFRPITPLLRQILANKGTSKDFEFHAFKRMWTRPGSNGPAIQVIDELYTAEAWNDEQKKVRVRKVTDDGGEPRAIVGIMCASDGTHLAQFGQAHSWPIYMTLGNQSKYVRSQPSSHALHHIGYLPSVRTLTFSL